ncbi:MAG: LysR family transcriptional regulator [Myxococcota bacterium]
MNLLRVFLAVAEAGSVTEAARALYVTQPAVSAALRRLQDALGAELVVRQGRGIALTTRGRRLAAEARPHLDGLLAAATSGGPSAATATRTVRLGLSDAAEDWLLPPLLDRLAAEAPGVTLVVLPVQFRTVPRAFELAEIDLAVTVADDVPAGTLRRPLFHGTFVALFDPRHVDVGEAMSAEQYLAHEHVIVSYNADRRGVVEDFLGMTRRVRVSVASFGSVGAVVDGRALVATVPASFAATVRQLRPHLATATLPFSLAGAPMELLWRGAVHDDAAVRFVREAILAQAESASPA